MFRRLALVLVAAAAGCSSGGDATVNPQALQAYIGLDPSINKAINLALFGVNTAATANIAPQKIAGDAKGTLVVTGQVDPGITRNKTVRVDAVYDGYSDDGDVVYATDPASLPLLALELKNVPYGTLSGSFEGVFTMSGALSGPLTLLLAIDGQLQPVGTMGAVERVPYSTRIYGTAVSDYGTYHVDFTR